MDGQMDNGEEIPGCLPVVGDSIQINNSEKDYC